MPRLDQDALRDALPRPGFLSAAVGARVAEFGADGTAVELTFTINEGPQIIIGRITVLGQRARVRAADPRGDAACARPAVEPPSLTTRAPAARGDGGVPQFQRRGGRSAERRDRRARRRHRRRGAGHDHRVRSWARGRHRARQADDGTALEDAIEFAPRGLLRDRPSSPWRPQSLRQPVHPGRPAADEREDLSGPSRSQIHRVPRHRHISASSTRFDPTRICSSVSRRSRPFGRPTTTFATRRTPSSCAGSARAPTSPGRYSLDYTRLFDERIPEEDQPLIDRLFPQVRLSYRLERADLGRARQPPHPHARAPFSAPTASGAARAIGSEVGYVKASFRLSNFRPLGSVP